MTSKKALAFFCRAQMTQASANALAFVVRSIFAKQSNLHCRRSADRIIVDVKCIHEYAFYILSLSGILPVVFASQKRLRR